MFKKHRPLHIHLDTSILFLTARIYGGFSFLAPNTTKIYLLKKAASILKKYKLELDAWAILDNHYHILISAAEGILIGHFVRELHGATAHFVKKGLPPLITEFGQQLTKEVTPWDNRQTKKLSFKKQRLERELKFANTNEKKTAVLAQFIARHKNRFKSKTYRGLKSAITKGHLTDPAIIVSLTTKDTPIWYQYVDHVIRNEVDYYRHLNYIHQNSVKHGYTTKMNEYEFSSIHKFIEKEGKEWVIGCFENYPIVDFEPQGIVD